MQGEAMAHKGKHEEQKSPSTGGALARMDQSQLDFEIDFYAKILERNPEYVDVLRVQGNNLTLKGRFADGLQIDKRLVQLRPGDPLAHYNLACSFALLKKVDLALKTLRRAIELGYRDFRYMKEDRDLDAVRHDPRFRQLLREFDNR
jgi:tetratricopeptide (TPR) repeat protein